VTGQNSKSAKKARGAEAQHSGKCFRAGIVSFLPVRPLIYGLDGSDSIDLVRASPPHQKRMLASGRLDVAFLATADLPSFGPRLAVLPAGCLAATGPTLLVKIFSQVKPEEMSVLWSDNTSRTAAILVQVLWASLYNRRLSVIPFDAASGRAPADAQAVLLIGDKVVTNPPIRFERHFDPIAMWHEMTGLPLVLGIWATTANRHQQELYDTLLAARQAGQSNLIEIATDHASAYGWPMDLAVRCLTQEMQFEFTHEHREGLEELLDLAAEHKLIASSRPLKYYPA